jgi:hypothetical protein
MSPRRWDGASVMPVAMDAVARLVSRETGELEDTGRGNGWHTMKVNLSTSERQAACIVYSSANESGSEAVAVWISCF